MKTIEHSYRSLPMGAGQSVPRIWIDVRGELVRSDSKFNGPGNLQHASLWYPSRAHPLLDSLRTHFHSVGELGLTAEELDSLRDRIGHAAKDTRFSCMNASSSWLPVTNAACRVLFMTLGKRIKAAREDVPLTQTELAERVGVRYQSVQQWEADRTAPTRSKMAKLAAALGVSVAELELGESQAEEIKATAASDEAVELAAAWDALPESKKRLYREAILADAAMAVVFPEISGTVVANASYHSMIARIRKSRAQLERQMKLKLDP